MSMNAVWYVIDIALSLMRVTHFYIIHNGYMQRIQKITKYKMLIRIQIG